MENNFKNMDDLFKESLSDFQAETNMDMWDSIAKGTAKRLFFRFIPARFNIYYLASLVLIAGAGVGLVLNGAKVSSSLQPDVIKVDETNINQPEMNTTPELFEVDQDTEFDEEIESNSNPEDLSFEEAQELELRAREEELNQTETFNDVPVETPFKEEIIEEVPETSDAEANIGEEVESGEATQTMGTIMQIEVETIEEDDLAPLNDVKSSVNESNEVDSLKLKNVDTVIKKEEKIHYIEKSKKIRRKIK